MKKYVLGVGAESDLNEIWEYIAADNIDAPTGGLESFSTHLKISQRILGWGTPVKTSRAFRSVFGLWAHI